MNTDKIIAESIAKDYAPKDNSKIVALKKLDNRAKLPAIIFAYSFGIVSSLVVGLGMCLAMQVIGNGIVSMALGIIIGIVGFIGCGMHSVHAIFYFRLSCLLKIYRLNILNQSFLFKY